MSEFGKAFNAARKSGKKVFTFNGKKYNTKLAADTPKKAPIPSAAPRGPKSGKPTKAPPKQSAAGGRATTATKQSAPGGRATARRQNTFDKMKSGMDNPAKKEGLIKKLRMGVVKKYQSKGK